MMDNESYLERLWQEVLDDDTMIHFSLLGKCSMYGLFSLAFRIIQDCGRSIVSLMTQLTRPSDDYSILLKVQVSFPAKAPFEGKGFGCKVDESHIKIFHYFRMRLIEGLMFLVCVAFLIVRDSINAHEDLGILGHPRDLFTENSPSTNNLRFTKAAYRQSHVALVSGLPRRCQAASSTHVYLSD